MNDLGKGAAGSVPGALFTGVSWWVNLFYQSTVLANPLWPKSVQGTAFFLSFFFAIGISFVCKGMARDDLKKWLKTSFWISLGLLVAALAIYVCLLYPLVRRQSMVQVLDIFWMLVDIIAMLGVVATITLVSLYAGSFIWGEPRQQTTE